MLYIPKIDDYLKILINEEVRDFLVINFSEYYKTIREEQKLIKAANLLYIFLTAPDEVEEYVESNYSDNCVYQYAREDCIVLAVIIKHSIKIFQC